MAGHCDEGDSWVSVHRLCVAGRQAASLTYLNPTSLSRPETERRPSSSVKELEREVRELRRANEMLKLAGAYFAQAVLDRRLKS